MTCFCSWFGATQEKTSRPSGERAGALLGDGRRGACGAVAGPRSTKRCRCRARVRRSGTTLSVARGQPACPAQPNIAGWCTSGQKGRSDFVSRGDHRATLREATAGPDRPVPSTRVNINNARVSEVRVPSWAETPGECCVPASRDAPSGAIPSETLTHEPSFGDVYRAGCRSNFCRQWV